VHRQLHETEASRAGQVYKQSYAAVVMSSPAPEHEMPDPPADPLEEVSNSRFFKDLDKEYRKHGKKMRIRLDNKAINLVRARLRRENSFWPYDNTTSDETQRLNILRTWLAGLTYNFENVKCHVWRLQENPWTENPKWLRLDPLE